MIIYDMLDCSGVCHLCIDILRVSRTAAKTDKNGLDGVKFYRIASTLTFTDTWLEAQDKGVGLLLI